METEGRRGEHGEGRREDVGWRNGEGGRASGKEKEEEE